ncbi:MAG: hypothetical protein U5K37_06310 [Natrialbaceae archaeon]|nr:hypothetical protein [Natrialbaceae archaeon]
MLRKRITGTHKKQIDTVVAMALPSHDQGRGKTLIDAMIADPTAPIEAYGGGHRENIRLTSPDDAVEYLKSNGGRHSLRLRLSYACKLQNGHCITSVPHIRSLEFD